MCLKRLEPVFVCCFSPIWLGKHLFALFEERGLESTGGKKNYMGRAELQEQGEKIWICQNAMTTFFLTEKYISYRVGFFPPSYSNPANTFHSKFIWGHRKRVLNADTCNGNVSSIHQVCWGWQQSTAPWSVQLLKYSCLTMGLSKRKYLLLPLAPSACFQFVYMSAEVFYFRMEVGLISLWTGSCFAKGSNGTLRGTRWWQLSTWSSLVGLSMLARDAPCLRLTV